MQKFHGSSAKAFCTDFIIVIVITNCDSLHEKLLVGTRLWFQQNVLRQCRLRQSSILSVIREKGESQNGVNKKTIRAKFYEK